MAAKMEIVGLAAEPKQAVTKSGDPVLNVSVAHTPRRKNQQTGEWEDAGDTLWVSAAFFGDEATFLAGHVRKGLSVRLEGEPTLRTYSAQDGSARGQMELKRAALSIIPRRPRQDAQQGGFGGGSPQGQGQWVQPPANGAQNGAQAAPGGFGDGFDTGDYSPF